ncbi:MAG: DUF2958 domain-containing protein [Gammaproteobacteria bacterium]
MGAVYNRDNGVRLSELAAIKDRLGLAVERDRYFKVDKPLSQYAAEAYRLGYIKA